MVAFADLPGSAHRLIERYLGEDAAALAWDIARTRSHGEIHDILGADGPITTYSIKVVAGFLVVYLGEYLEVYRVGAARAIRTARRLSAAPQRYWNRYILAGELLHLDSDGSLRRIAGAVLNTDAYNAACMDYTRMMPDGTLYGSPSGRPSNIPASLNPVLIYDESGRPAAAWRDLIGRGNCCPWCIPAERPYVMPTPRGGLLYHYPQRYMIA